MTKLKINRYFVVFHFQDAAKKMSGDAAFVAPNPKSFNFFEKKYKVFLKMLADQLEYRQIMA